MISVVQVLVTPHVRKTIAQRLLVLWPQAYTFDNAPLGPDALAGHHTVVYRDKEGHDTGDWQHCVSLRFHTNDFEIAHDEELTPFVERLRKAFT